MVNPPPLHHSSSSTSPVTENWVHELTIFPSSSVSFFTETRDRNQDPELKRKASTEMMDISKETKELNRASEDTHAMTNQERKDFERDSSCVVT